MVFGYWAIITGIICLVGFTYMVVEGFGEEPVEKPLEPSEKAD